MKIIINKITQWFVKSSPVSLLFALLTLAFGILVLSFILFILLFSLSEIFILLCHYFYQLIFVPLLLNLSLSIIFITNPIYALLILICIFLYSAFLLLSLHIQFIAMIYIIIYIGAIAILFLFVLMMFNLKQLTHSYSIYTKDIDLYIFLFAILLFYFKIKTEFTIFNTMDQYINTYVWHKSLNIKYYVNFVYSDILIFGNLLYTYHSFIFLCSGLLLFIAMIGSLVLALSVTEQTLPNSLQITSLNFSYTNKNTELQDLLIFNIIILLYFAWPHIPFDEFIHGHKKPPIIHTGDRIKLLMREY